MTAVKLIEQQITGYKYVNRYYLHDSFFLFIPETIPYLDTDAS